MVKAESKDCTSPHRPAAIGRPLLGRRLGRYEILCPLASGGMATVFIGRAIGLAGFERLVAIKLLHPHLAHDSEFVAMFLDEARFAARIRHPNVVATQDINDSDGDGYFLVMDYIEGDHLAHLLSRAVRSGARIPSGVVARMLVDALHGLDAAHRATDDQGERLHLVHRDLSPENLLVGTDGVVRVTDFGVARAAGRVSSTRAGEFKGKLAYTAPEQAESADFDHRADLFAMGIVLWETLTSARLFRADDDLTTLSRLRAENIPPPSQVDAALSPWDSLLRKALDRDPDSRFQSAAEMADAIEELASHQGGLATPRAVGDVLDALAGDKVTEERRRIRAALDANRISDNPPPQSEEIFIGGSGTVRVRNSTPPIPLPVAATSTELPTRPTSPRYRWPVEGVTELTSPGSAIIVIEHPPKSAAIFAGVLLVVAMTAATAGYFVSRAEFAKQSPMLYVPTSLQTPAPLPFVIPPALVHAAPEPREATRRAHTSASTATSIGTQPALEADRALEQGVALAQEGNAGLSRAAEQAPSSSGLQALDSEQAGGDSASPQSTGMARPRSNRARRMPIEENPY